MKNVKIPAKFENLVTMNSMEGLSEKELQEYKLWLDKNNFDGECIELDYTLMLPTYDFGLHNIEAKPYMSKTNDMNSDEDIMVINVRYIDDEELEMLGNIERTLNLTSEKTGIVLDISVSISSAYFIKNDGSAIIVDLSNKNIQEIALLLLQKQHELSFPLENKMLVVDSQLKIGDEVIEITFETIKTAISRLKKLESKLIKEKIILNDKLLKANAQ